MAMHILAEFRLVMSIREIRLVIRLFRLVIRQFRLVVSMVFQFRLVIGME